MADIAHATDIAGHITAEAAHATGLAEGMPLLVGTGDSGAEAISTGVFKPGDIMVQMGSSCYFVYLTDHLVSEDRLWPGNFIIPGTYSICAGTNTVGTLTAWLRSELWRDAVIEETSGENQAFSVMVEAARKIPPGSDGLICLPYFAGERTSINDPQACGAFFSLLTSHSRAPMTRAALEGISCTIVQHFDILAEDKLPVDKIMCVGGGTKNDVWLQIVADMLERPVHTSDITIGVSYGDALMAAIGSGCYQSWDNLSEAVKPARTIHPPARDLRYLPQAPSPVQPALSGHTLPGARADRRGPEVMTGHITGDTGVH